MATTPDVSIEERKARLENTLAELGQYHIFRWWDELSPARRAEMLEHLECIDWKQIERLLAISRTGSESGLPPDAEGKLEAGPCILLPRSADEKEREASAVAAGEGLLREGKVGVITVAGGQGTRLGFDKPKGLFPISPLIGKSLFRLHAENIMALQRRYGATIPWAIMVSDATDGPTRDYFAEKSFFKLDPDNVFFFRQGMLPAIDGNGRLILAAKNRLSLSPNGHGGTLSALCDEGVADAMSERGVKHLFYFQVDNPAVNIADPAYLGHHATAGAEMSLKVMRRRDRAEKVGVLVRLNYDPQGRLYVVEYSDLELLSDFQDEADAPPDKLQYPMGSPAIHILDVDFVKRIGRGADLPFHLARKKIPYIDDAGKSTEPIEPNGIKFEMFIFDALPMARNAVAVEMDRNEEFAPVKNAEGEDSAETCRQAMMDKFARRLERAGVKVPRDADGKLLAKIEISPLFALTGEELAEKAPREIEPGAKVYLG